MSVEQTIHSGPLEALPSSLAQSPPRAFKDHLPGLDGLRGIAALLVLLGHVPEAAWGHVFGTLMSRLYVPAYGVDIFFVLSGFLITRILLVDKARGVPLRYFLARRFLRIFPIYYLTLFVYGLWMFKTGQLHGYNLSALEACALYLSNFFFAINIQNVEHIPSVMVLVHTWSLAVEEHFYLVWPFAVYLLSYRATRTAAWLFFIPLAVVSATIFAIHFGPMIPTAKGYPAGEWITRSTTCRAISLAWGAIFACNEGWLRGHTRRVALVIALLLAGAFGVFLFRKLFLPLSLRVVVQFIAFSMISASIVLTVIGMRNSTAFPQKIVSSPPLRYLGRISYGVYLYHPFVYTALGVFITATPAPGLWYRPFIAFAGTLMLATASFFLFERPILKLQNRFRAKPQPVLAGGA